MGFTPISGTGNQYRRFGKRYFVCSLPGYYLASYRYHRCSKLPSHFCWDVYWCSFWKTISRKSRSNWWNYTHWHWPEDINRASLLLLTSSQPTNYRYQTKNYLLTPYEFKKTTSVILHCFFNPCYCTRANKIKSIRFCI